MSRLTEDDLANNAMIKSAVRSSLTAQIINLLEKQNASKREKEISKNFAQQNSIDDKIISQCARYLVVKGVSIALNKTDAELDALVLEFIKKWYGRRFEEESQQ